MSAVIYTNNITSTSALITEWLESVHRINVQIHLVEEYGEYYPVNHLRNAAQDNAYTRVVFMVDVDFVAMAILYSKLRQYLPVFDKQRSSEKNALVIPAFMVNDGKHFPNTKQDINQTWNKQVHKFIYDYAIIGNHTYNRSLKPHDQQGNNTFENWIKTNDDLEMPYVKQCEVYYVINRMHSVRYSEIFLQRWFDKISHVYHLHSLGVRFWVYARGYIVHLPHERVRGAVTESSAHCARRYLRYFYEEMSRVQRGQRVGVA